MAQADVDGFGSRIAAYPGAAAGQQSVLITPQGAPTAGLRMILCMPGHGGTALGALPGATSLNKSLRSLAQSGYAVLGIDAGGPATFGNDTEINAVMDAINWAISVYGCKGGKVGFLCWSMGGLSTFEIMKRHPELVTGAYLFAPATDLKYLHDASYSPPYSIPAGAAPGNYTAEIDTAYGGNYATNSVGHDPMIDAASGQYANLAPSVTIAHATDDTTTIHDGTVLFLSRVNNPRWKLRTPEITGGHTGLFSSIPDTDPVDFFNTLVW